LTSAEFSPRKLCGVFFVAPVEGLNADGGNASPNRFNSKGSFELLWVPFVVVVFGEFLFLFVITSNSSRSVDEPWLVGDHGSCLVWGWGGGVGDDAFPSPPHGSGFGMEWAGCHGSPGAAGVLLGGGEESEFDCHGEDCYKQIDRHQLWIAKANVTDKVLLWIA
jgi:hypothetical protein